MRSFQQSQLEEQFRRDTRAHMRRLFWIAYGPFLRFLFWVVLLVLVLFFASITPAGAGAGGGGALVTFTLNAF